MECAEGGIDVGRRHFPRPSATPPRSVFLTAFLVRFAGGGEGAGEVSGSDGDGGGGSAGGGSGRI